MSDKIGRNDKCPCGSGKKYKKCCMNKDKASVTSTLPADVIKSIDDAELDDIPAITMTRMTVMTDGFVNCAHHMCPLCSTYTDWHSNCNNIIQAKYQPITTIYHGCEWKAPR